MPAKSGPISTITPKAYDPLVKFITIARTDTTAFQAFTLPKGAIPVGYYVLGRVASDAATTATLDIGTTATANELVASYDVKTAATATGYNVVGAKAVGAVIGVAVTVDTPVFAKYTETGTASSTGGPWLVKFEYLLTGPGETL